MEFKTRKKLNSGMCSDAYILDDEYIQLVGKREDSYDIYKDIKSNSDLLVGKLSCIEFPSNMILVKPNSDYPYGCLIYKMVKGEPLNPEKITKEEQDELAKRIVEFNTEMHNLDIHWDRDKAINHEVDKVNRNIELLKNYLSDKEINKLKEYSIKFSRYLNSKESFCITHGDLWADNLIMNNNKLTGIIDFGNMAYFLPEVDYASMWNMIDGFIDKLLLYSKEKITKESIILFVIHREVCVFEYIMNDSMDEVNFQINKIKEVLELIK